MQQGTGRGRAAETADDGALRRILVTAAGFGLAALSLWFGGA